MLTCLSHTNAQAQIWVTMYNAYMSQQQKLCNPHQPPGFITHRSMPWLLVEQSNFLAAVKKYSTDHVSFPRASVSRHTQVVLCKTIFPCIIHRDKLELLHAGVIECLLCICYMGGQSQVLLVSQKKVSLIPATTSFFITVSPPSSTSDRYIIILASRSVFWAPFCSGSIVSMWLGAVSRQGCSNRWVNLSKSQTQGTIAHLV